jgi:hypothetical protein
MEDRASSEDLIAKHVALMAHSHSGNDGFGHASRRFAELWDSLVPDQGQAATVQGEVLRSIDRLRSEDYRNGCINWDDYFESMVHFLRERFAGAECFDAPTRRRIQSDLKAVVRNGRRGSQLDTAQTMKQVFGRLIEHGVMFVESNSTLIPLDQSVSRAKPWWQFW